jgi:hypothetical protein
MKRNLEMLLTDLILQHFCACLKPGPGFLMPYIVVFVMFNYLRWDTEIVHFVDIGGFVHHHCLNFLFIIKQLWSTIPPILSTKWTNTDCHGCDCIVVGFTTTCAMSAYHHWCCEFKSGSGRGVQHYVIKSVSDLQQVNGFLRFPSPIKLTVTI